MRRRTISSVSPLFRNLSIRRRFSANDAGKRRIRATFYTDHAINARQARLSSSMAERPEIFLVREHRVEHGICMLRVAEMQPHEQLIVSCEHNGCPYSGRLRFAFVSFPRKIIENTASYRPHSTITRVPRITFVVVGSRSIERSTMLPNNDADDHVTERKGKRYCL